MEKRVIQPVTRPINGVVTVPGSKSITNRALILAALANGSSTLTGALFSDDTRHMSDCLNRLGIQVIQDEEAESFEVHGLGGLIPQADQSLFVGNSGTTARFIAALVALGHGTYRIDGIERMRERPIEDLLTALRQLGADARSDRNNGCPPLTVQATGLTGGAVRMRADVSSQFLTGLLMVSPLAEREVEIEIEGDLASKPYVDITLKMMEQWGAAVENECYRRFTVTSGAAYRARDYGVEPDASSASYFLAAAAATGGSVRVPGLSRSSLQGDVAFAAVLEQMGCQVLYGDDFVEVEGAPLRGVDVDMNGISDTVMTLAAIAPFASSPTTIRNVAHIRHKETDRIAAIATELRRLGVRVEERTDGLLIQPAERLLAAEIHTYEDHRIAMSFAVAGLRSPGITILDPACVAKTFPQFFEKLDALTR
jgi:3-phosphoshikimate 1-carboxyvinyltransferase